VRVNALFGLFGGSKAPAAPAIKTGPIVDDIIKISGASASPKTISQIEQLVKQLQPYSVKGAAKSPLLFGEYEIIFSSQPLAGANPRQVLSNDKIVESTESKAFGLLTVTTAASGSLRAVGPDTYEVSLTKIETKGGLGGGAEAIDAVRTETVLYLDDRIRVVRVAEEDGEQSLVVSKRKGAKLAAADDDEEEDEEEEAPRKQGTGLVFPSFGTRSGTATVAEREVRRKMESDAVRKPSGTMPIKQAAPVASPTAKLVRAVDPKAVAAAKAREVAMAKEAAAKEAAAKAQAQAKAQAEAKARAEADKKRAEAEAAAKAKAAQAAKEKAEADKRAQAERAGAIRAQLAELEGEYKAAQAAARDTAKEAKDVERTNQAVLRSVAAAKQAVAAAEADVTEVGVALVSASKAKGEAEAALKNLLSELSAAQGKLKATLAANARK